MKEGNIRTSKKASARYEELEAVVRGKVQGFIQDILEEELEDYLGRGKSERIQGRIDIPPVYRNGHGKPRNVSLLNGTVRVRRPRLRDGEGFESKILPLF